jgi:hypothetical protein
MEPGFGMKIRFLVIVYDKNSMLRKLISFTNGARIWYENSFF